MFVIERPAFRLTRSFYVLSAVILMMTVTGPALLGLLLTMHIHVGPPRKPKGALEKNSSIKLNLAEIPECDLPPLPNREGPYDYRGHPYYLYPSGDVDGFAGRAWWRVSLDEFKRHVDRRMG
jgi:hypothetical protein